MELLDQITFWHWWIAAVVLLILETLAPGAIFLWMGVAAAAVGVILLLAPQLGWEIQMVLFAVLSLLTVVGWKYWRGNQVESTDQPALNRRGQQYVGRTFTLSDPIRNGVGKIIVDDSTWKVQGPDLRVGSVVKVTRVNGAILEVVPA